MWGAGMISGKCGIKYSVIVLLEEDSKDFSGFIKELYDIFSRKGDSFEILVIANGTEGFLRDEARCIYRYNDHLKLFTINKKTSQAVCLRAALKESGGEIVVVCGSYQQITKDSFSQLLDAFDDETDIISPWRQNRVDPSFNQFQSRVFNELVRIVTGTELHDLSCTVKIVRREVLEETELYGNMYRFLPILASRKGFTYKEVQCEHYQERGETGFYSFFEYLERIIDILTLYFNTRFTRKPLRFFGSIGMLFFTVGLLILGYIFLERFLSDYPIGDRPALLLMSVLFITLGIQAAGGGLLGEIIVFTQGRNIKEYSVSCYADHQYIGPERRNRGRYHTSRSYIGDRKRQSDSMRESDEDPV